MHRVIGLTLGLWIVAAGFVLSACSKQEEAEYVNVTISAPHREAVRNSLSQKVEFGLKGNFGLPDPTTVPGIGCYAVFLEYPEFPAINFCEDTSNNLITAPDDMFGMFPSTQTEFDIPVLAGANRRIVILAFAETLGFCPPVKGNLGPFEANLSHPIFIGDAFADIFGGTTEVDVFATISTGTRLDDCSGPLFDQFDSNFQPTTISNLIGWYDPSDLTTTFSDDGCATPQTPGGGTLGCVTDKSGNANNATNATGTERPNFLATTINGRSAMSFDGVDDYLDLGSGIQNGTERTIFVVFQSSAGAAGQESLIGANSAGTNANQLELFAGTRQLAGTAGAAVQATGSTVSLYSGTPQLGIFALSAIGSSVEVYVNDATTFDGTNTGAIFVTPTQNYFIGGTNNSGGLTNPYTGEMGEVLIYDRVLSASERIQVRDYLAARWNIP